MLDKGKRVLSMSSVALAAVIVFGFLGFVSSARANNADDDAAAQAFKSNCVVCHGADGTGTATGKSLKAPDLHSDTVQKMTTAQLVATVTDGKNNMPPFKNTLSKDQIDGLVAYVRATFGKKK
jgi:mono/diheme cytochrome c family protein